MVIDHGVVRIHAERFLHIAHRETCDKHLALLIIFHGIFHVVNKKQNPFPVLVYAAGDLVAVALDCPGEFRFVGRADVRTQKDFIFSVHRVKAEKAEAADICAVGQFLHQLRPVIVRLRRSPLNQSLQLKKPEFNDRVEFFTQLSAHFRHVNSADIVDGIIAVFFHICPYHRKYNNT